MGSVIIIGVLKENARSSDCSSNVSLRIPEQPPIAASCKQWQELLYCDLPVLGLCWVSSGCIYWIIYWVCLGVIYWVYLGVIYWGLLGLYIGFVLYIGLILGLYIGFIYWVYIGGYILGYMRIMGKKRETTIV